MVFILLLGVILFLRAVVFLAQSVCGPESGRVTVHPRDELKTTNPAGSEHRLCVCPVRNDFSVAAVSSVLAENAGWGRVVVADDSDAGDGRTLKELLFGENWVKRVEVVRREGRRGWKAGNLNAALRSGGQGVREFAVLDADTVVPAGFLAALSARMAEERSATVAAAQSPERSNGPGEMIEEGGARVTAKPLELSDAANATGLEATVALRLDATIVRRVGFVQARLEWNALQPGALAWWMGPSVGLHFRTSMRARAQGGFTMFHGHAALIDMEAWREAGGFPEIVSEDLGFTLRLRALGWRGVYADSIVACEDFPPTVAAWRRRQDKWVRGTADCLRREAGRFLRAKHVPLREKADMLLNAAWLYLSPVALAWFILLAVQQPALMHRLRHPTALMQAPAWDLVPTFGDWLHGLHFTLRWSWPVGGVMLFLMVAPLVPAIVAWHEDRKRMLESRLQAESMHERVPKDRRPGLGLMIPPEGGTPAGRAWNGAAVLRFWVAGSYLWLSSLVVETLSLLVWMVTGKARFDNTLGKGRGPGWRVYHPNHPLVHVLEVLAGGWFLWESHVLVNPWLAAPGFALITAPLAVWIGWDSRAIRLLAILPLLIALGMFALMLREMLR